MIIGTFGDLIFEVSHSKIKTFNELTETVGSRWEAHEVIGATPKAQFVGAEQGEVSFVITFSISLGIEPRKQVERLHRMIITGQHAPLIIGGQLVGTQKGEWYIESAETAWKNVNSSGQIDYIEMNLTLKEYV
jgi:phage protein U